MKKMPTYLDGHDLGNMTEEQIKQAQNSPTDEFGIIHIICFTTRKRTSFGAF
ncbi:MAG: hypothetical protein ACJ70Q_02770 [Nitrososphaera sp.]